jgi:4'-phosphopantetheinyl transferase
VGDHGLRFHRIRHDSGAASLIRINPAEIQVWGLALDIEGPELARALALLSDEERIRADRLVSDQHRRRFIAAHAGLRWVLSRYDPRHPAHLLIERTSAGKPYLRETPSVRFNLSHSHGRALVAVATDRAVGIDLEKVRPDVDVLRLARRFLSTQDQAYIEGDGPMQRHERFLQTWVAREAVAKADGTGIKFPIHHDHVEMTGGGAEGRLVREDRESEEPVRLIRFLPLESGWIGAVSAEGADWTVVCRGEADGGFSRGT